MKIGNTYATSFPLCDPATGEPTAPSDIRYQVRKNGADVGDSVTITADGTYAYRYHLSYNPAGEVEGDQYTILIEAQYSSVWYAAPPIVIDIEAVERGTDGANTTTPLSASGIRAALGMADATYDSDILGIVNSLTTLSSRLSASRAGYLDNLNVGGSVSSQADVEALNQSASRRLILTSVKQFERPEAATSSYTVELRTYDEDGAAVNADITPTLTPIGTVSGDLSANLSAASNPATGVYRWTYTVEDDAVVEEVRFDVSATMTSVFTLSLLTQVTDFVSTPFTTTDQANLTAIYNKLPSTPYLLGTASADGSGYSILLTTDLDDALETYNGPTREEATSDKNEIITRGNIAWTGGGGGGGGVIYAPVLGIIPDRQRNTLLEFYFGEVKATPITVIDAALEEVDLTGKTLRIVIEDQNKLDVQVVENDDIDVLGNVVTFTNSADVTSSVRRLSWALRDITDGDTRLMGGSLTVLPAAQKDEEP